MARARAARRVSRASSLAAGQLAARTAKRPWVRLVTARAWHAPLWGAAGLALIAWSFAASREGHSGAPIRLVFWVGFVTMIAPIAARLLAESTSRGERIALVTLVGLLAYGVKVLRDPLMFVMSDEFMHLAAAQRIVATHKLFQALPISGLVAAPGYPGLETVTATICEITGLSLFVSGLIVIAMARVIVMLALFQLYDRVSGSARIAGLATLLFAANGNFLYWSAQFSYESLALPLFVLALALYVRRSERPTGRLSLTLTLVLLIATITATHHLTSYALAASLAILTLLSWRLHRPSGRATGLALLATACAAVWFFLVATGTRAYLSYVFTRTADAVANGTHSAHTPFQASTGALNTPIVEQIVSFAGVLLVVVTVLWTLRRARRVAVLHSPIGVFLAVCGLGFLAFYPLRLFPGAWETGNRGQEFLFIGTALLLGIAIVRLAGSDGDQRRRGLLLVAILVVICGGVISGWPSPLLLAQPLKVRVDKAVVVPQGLSAATWAIHELPADSTYIGDEATGRELLVDGAHFSLFGNGGNVPAILESPLFPSWQRAVLVDRGIDYVVVDRRKVAANNQSAYFFQPASDPADGLGYYPAGVRKKLELPTTSTVFDSGDIVIFEVRGLREPPPRCTAVGVPSQARGMTCRAPYTTVTIAGPNATVDLPSLNVRFLRLEIEHRTAGVYVTILVQLQNVGTSAYAPDPDYRHLYLTVDGHRIYRRRSVPERTDNLDGRKPLRPGTAIEGSLTFVLHNPSRVAAFLSEGAELGVRLPSPPGKRDHHELGVIKVAPPSRGTPR